jgi:iron complex outermembrane receptor protein
VVNKELLQDLNPTYLYDVAKYVAGVAPGYYTAQDSFLIRSNESGTNLIDGFSVTGFTPYVPMALVEQVEFIKGAQGVMYGSVSGGGVVNRVRKSPQKNFSQDLSAEIGSFGYYSSVFDSTGTVPFADNKDFAFRVISSFSYGGNRQDNLITEHPEQTHSFQLKYFIPGGGSVLAFVDYNNREWTPASEVTSGDPVTGMFDTSLHKEHSAYASLVIKSKDVRAGFIAEKMTGPIASRVSFQYSDSPWTDDALFPINNIAAPDPLWARYRKELVERSSFFYDGVAKFSLGDVASNIVNFGFEYTELTRDSKQIVNYGPNFDYGNFTRYNPPRGALAFNIASPNNTMQTNEALDFESKAAFLNWRASFLNERFSVVGGIRTLDYEQKIINKRNPAASRPPKEGDHELYRAGGVAKITDNITAFVGYSETFSVNTGLGFIPPGSQITQSNYRPDPGTKSLEGGIRFSFLDQRLNLDAAIYELRQTGRTAGGGSSFSPIVLLPDNVNKGFEAQLSAAPTRNWNLIAAFTTADIVNATGARTADVAEFLASFWTKYTFREGAAKGLGVGFGVSHIGDKVPFAAPSGKAGTVRGWMIPSVTTYDATVSYTRNNWLLQLNGVNIGDKLFVKQFGGSNLAIWVDTGVKWRLSARYKW